MLWNMVILPSIRVQPRNREWQVACFHFQFCCIKRFLIFCRISRYFGYGRRLSRRSVLFSEFLDTFGYGRATFQIVLQFFRLSSYNWFWYLSQRRSPRPKSRSLCLILPVAPLSSSDFSHNEEDEDDEEDDDYDDKDWLRSIVRCQSCHSDVFSYLFLEYSDSVRCLISRFLQESSLFRTCTVHIRDQGPVPVPQQYDKIILRDGHYIFLLRHLNDVGLGVDSFESVCHISFLRMLVNALLCFQIKPFRLSIPVLGCCEYLTFIESLLDG